MRFCDACGAMMKTEGDRWVCTDCGETEARGESEGFVTSEAQDTSDVIETAEDVQFEGQPTTDDETCEDCGNGEAYYYFKQTASADEPPTRFFKCTDCGHQWRGYN